MQKAVIKASRGLLRDFSELEHLQVSVKSNNSFVSSADTRADKILREELMHARPTYSLISEESAEIVGEDPSYRWIIDPLDGTSNYIHGFPHWAISVALEKDNQVIAAVTYDPVKNEMFWAEKGYGAYVNDRKIRVSSRKNINTTLVSFGTLTTLPKIAKICPSIRRCGSMSLDMAYLACGRLDLLFISPNGNPWDVAGGSLIVKEAGGVLMDHEYHPVDHYSKLEVMGNIDLLKTISKL
jgi:myo-inositol-1(or 4)-monophosphatase